MPYELTDVEVSEVSLTGSPANRRKYLVVKSEEAMEEETIQEEEVKAALDPEDAAKQALKILNQVEKPSPELRKALGILATIAGYGYPPREGYPAPYYRYKEEAEKSGDKEALEWLKSVEEQDERLKAAEEQIAEFKKQARINELAEVAKSCFNLDAETLYALEQLRDKELVEKVINESRTAKKAIAEAGLFQEVGKSTSLPEASSPTVRLQERVAQKIAEKPDLRYDQALELVIKANPALYEEHRREIGRAK